MIQKGKRLLLSPLLHCLVLGGVIAWILSEPSGPLTLQLQAQQLEDMQRNWQRRTARSPNERELSSLVNNAVDNEVLYQEAVKRHFDQLPVVRNRLLQLADFLKLGDKENPDDQYHQALILGLDGSDPMIRRYMIGSIREAMERELPLQVPAEEEIKAYYLNHNSDFSHPPRIKISHIYIGGFDHQAQEKAKQLLVQLQEQTLSPQQAIPLGDPFYGGHHLPWQNQNQLANRLGPQFSEETIKLLETDNSSQWIGPVTSSYGLHLVWIHEKQSRQLAPMAQVSTKIKNILLKQQRDTALQQKVQQLRKNYLIELPEQYQVLIESSKANPEIATMTTSNEEATL